VKPHRGDYRHKLLISGDELRELKKLTYSMAEAFGLDRKIENYQGTRPITLYRWDLECLMSVIDLALKGERDYPDKSTVKYEALQRLGEQIHQEYDAVYGHEKIAQLGIVATRAERPALTSPATTLGRKAVPARFPGGSRSRTAPSRSSTRSSRL
jgi:hypothetical protein